MRPRFFWALCQGWLVVLTTVMWTVPARGAVSDTRAAENRLEDDLLEGEIDAEDFVASHLSPVPLGSARGGVYLGLDAFTVQRVSGAETGIMLVLELPLERFMHPHGGAAPIAAVTTPPTSVFEPRGLDGPAQPWTALGLGVSLGGSAIDVSRDAAFADAGHGIAQSVPAAERAAPKAERAAPGPVLAVTTEVARSCVRAALRTAGLGDDHRLESVAARARSSGALPELRLRAARTFGESGRVSLSEDDPSRYVATGAATNVVEARVTFRLDRLLFADEEIVVERARLDRSEQRLRITGKVLETLFAWQKAYALLQDPALPSEERMSAVLREAESSAILDIMTGGWFGAYRAALAVR